MALGVAVSKTCSQIADVGSDEQPSLTRAATLPVYLRRESSGRLEITAQKRENSFGSDSTTFEESDRVDDDTSCDDAGGQLGFSAVPQFGYGMAYMQAPMLLGCSIASSGFHVGGAQVTSSSHCYKGHGGKQIPRLQPGEWTTLMIRNLPNQYTRDDFVSWLIEEGFAGRFDFLYFPVDFETHAGMGYAFVNMVSHSDAKSLWSNLDGFSSWSQPCKKVCRVSWGQPMQGLEAHVARYRNSPLMHAHVPDAYRPMLFVEGKRASFPPPTKKIKPPHKGNQRMLLPRSEV